jgi:membrane protein implicated in regulation of membrane protease activity
MQRFHPDLCLLLCAVCIVMAGVTLWRAEATFIVFLVLAPLLWSLHRAAQTRAAGRR